LVGVTDPEKKRKIIGELFIRVFEGEADKLKPLKYLAQGTIYPDRIESAGTGHGSAVIKSHHNVGGLPEKLGLEIIEPLADLFKDEVREVGRKMGIPSSIIERQPFPGPGLAIRILGEITEESLNIVREADAIFIEELTNSDIMKNISQALCVLLPIKTVGVMGDDRTYDRVIALRAVTTSDFMTVDWYRIPEDILSRISARIVNEVNGVNRVVYDITTKPPATIEWE
jgi:GMP synthase (glutamine-hydrolysing)